ncbi:dihydrolipoamide acetyltransferase family protein, partial [Roseibium sp.]
MGTFVIRMPDVGEGIAEAELVEWFVKEGDTVREDDIVASVMTDKATVEIPSSAEGTVTWLGGEIGQEIAIGADLLKLDVAGEGNAAQTPAGSESPPPNSGATSAGRKEVEEAKGSVPAPKASVADTVRPASQTASMPAAPNRARNADGKPIASPSVRRRAREAGADLRRVPGSGPAGRIIHADLDAHLNAPATSSPAHSSRQRTSVEEIKVLGLRRKVSERMAAANAHIPHITIVEEVDVTALEDLRQQLNATYASARGKLTVLPFIMRAIVLAVAEQPALNANFLDDQDLIRQFGAVHVGIATQTPNGLMVPVVKHAEALSLWEAAAEVSRLAKAARKGNAGVKDLGGSTISISSLGPLGALATTPIINKPEVA